MSNRNRYEQFLQNKTVCIVGPSPSIKNTPNKKDQVDKIQSYDLIVRLNKCMPVPKTLSEYVGERTDIIYNCMSPDPESGGFIDIDFLKDKISWIVASLPNKPPFAFDISNFNKRNQGTINFTTPRLEYYNQISSKMKTRPNTGTMAILDILSCQIKELYITGITFFRGGYVPEYRNYNEEQVLKRMADHGNHKQEPQIEYIKSALKNDQRVTTDKYLKAILDE
jgi:hypothetical protein